MMWLTLFRKSQSEKQNRNHPNCDNLFELLDSLYSFSRPLYLNEFPSRIFVYTVTLLGMLLKRGMGNREWGMGNGEWGMGNEK